MGRPPGRKTVTTSNCTSSPRRTSASSPSKVPILKRMAEFSTILAGSRAMAPATWSLGAAKNLHRGVKDELWTIIHSAAYADFKPELAACQKVTCAGHSLGGALCDMWTHLANNGVEDSSDTSCWTKLQWWQ